MNLIFFAQPADGGTVCTATGSNRKYRVEDMGSFIELEHVVSENESTDHGYRQAQELMQQLQVDESRLVEGSYVDLFDP